MVKVGTPIFNSKNNDKRFTRKTNENNVCNCWVCEELKDRKKILQRQNFLLPVIIGFEQ